jgi:hypothetical protein
MAKTACLLMIIVMAFGVTSFAMDIWAEFKGEAVYGEGADTCDVGPVDLAVWIYFINDDFDRTVWTTPFTFFGTGSVDSITKLLVGLNDFTDLHEYCHENLFEITENYPDLILPVNNCVYCRGLIPYSETVQGGQYYVLRIAGNTATEGEFCLAMGDFAEDSLDWLFEEPVPQFDTTCIPVRYKDPGFECGDVNCDGFVNIIDITRMICLFYSGCGPGCDLKLYDLDGNFVRNILDITYFINYLYYNGPEPVCLE